jgi:hypothetical protein
MQSLQASAVPVHIPIPPLSRNEQMLHVMDSQLELLSSSL